MTPLPHLSPAARAYVFVLCGGLLAIVVVLGFLVSTNVKSNDIKNLSQEVVRIGERIEDCSAEGGECYKENQKRTGAAIQVLLESIQAQVHPHRLRNEAENLCQVELFGGILPAATAQPVEVAIQIYNDCVLRRSGGTEPPALPENPYSSTTTTTTGRR